MRGVSFALSGGRTLGLVGENGAGKTTLMNILGGHYPPDEGRMWLGGVPYVPRHPQDAARCGVAFIHQELNLFGNLSIAENLFLTAFPTVGRLPCIHRGNLRRRAAALLEEVGLSAGPDTPVERLSAGEQQLVEIAKALSLDARLMIFDEPTTSLTRQETERLFARMGQLRVRGLSLIYISHNLEDVLRLCDDIVVLRDGEQVGGGPRAAFTVDRLVSMMVGRSITRLFPARAAPVSAPPLLEVRHLTQPGMVADITFTLHRGEVLGLAGLMGSGRSELARILFGLDPFARGEIRLAGRPLRPAPRRSIRRGLALVTENRREEGLCLEAAIADNLALVTLAAHARGPFGWLERAGLRRAIEGVRGAVRLTPTAPDAAPASTLSGGNQQKVVLAKWLLARPAVWILDEPTRGIDVGAKSELYQLISDLASEGTGVLVISSEIEELFGLCDRILVLSRGEIRDELARDAFDRERVLRAALGERPRPGVLS
ncbi:MAG: sugar ABC transporter ATP-binding protein [Verrucomicrobia bacterium]|nr:sugar ABC transporter ATP-binding protein [Verrucomicrobiota bacterium]